MVLMRWYGSSSPCIRSPPFVPTQLCCISHKTLCVRDNIFFKIFRPGLKGMVPLTHYLLSRAVVVVRITGGVQCGYERREINGKS